MIRFALIGAGRIGHVHARSIAAHPQAELAMICDPFEDNAKSLAEQYQVPYVLDPAEVFASDVDAIVIGSPTPMHVEHILAGVRAGKRVLCEKPVALDLAEAERCRDELGAEADRVMLGFNRRFDPTFADIHARVAAGEIGELQQFTVISRDSAAPPAQYVASSGGIFRDMSIHDFDMVRHFLGDIVEVSAFGSNTIQEIADEGDFDQAVITLRAADGRVATIINSRTCCYGYDQRMEAFGDKGSLSADNLTSTQVRKAGPELTEGRGAILDFFLDRYVNAYALELSAFIEAVQADGPVSPNVHDGVLALQIADAATVSAKERRTVTL